jgi:hypothetical protein
MASRWPEMALYPWKIEIFVVTGPQDCHFWKKTVSKGPQDDPKMVRVSLQFH